MLTAFILAALAGSPTATPPNAASDCRTRGLVFAAGEPGRRAGPQKLTDQPPANLYLTVHRHVGGCPTPAIVRTGIGR